MFSQVMSEILCLKTLTDSELSTADIVFVVREQKHEVYLREENNLVYKTSVNLCETLCGMTIPIVTLDKRCFNVSVVHIIRPGYEKIVKGEGFPVLGENGKRSSIPERVS